MGGAPIVLFVDAAVLIGTVVAAVGMRRRKRTRVG